MLSYILSVNYSWHEINMRARRSQERQFIGLRPSQSHFDNGADAKGSQRTVLCRVKIQFWISCSLRRTLSNPDSIYPGRGLLERCDSSMAIIEQFSSVQDLGEEANNTSTEALIMITQQNRQTRKKCPVAFIWGRTPIRDLNILIFLNSNRNIITFAVYLRFSIFEKGYHVVSLFEWD